MIATEGDAVVSRIGPAAVFRAQSPQEVVAVHAEIESRRPEIEALCRELGVRRLDVFGSAVGDAFDVMSSDVDVLVEFEDGPGFDYFGAYFGL